MIAAALLAGQAMPPAVTTPIVPTTSDQLWQEAGRTSSGSALRGIDARFDQVDWMIARELRRGRIDSATAGSLRTRLLAIARGYHLQTGPSIELRNRVIGQLSGLRGDLERSRRS